MCRPSMPSFIGIGSHWGSATNGTRQQQQQHTDKQKRTGACEYNLTVTDWRNRHTGRNALCVQIMAVPVVGFVMIPTEHLLLTAGCDSCRLASLEASCCYRGDSYYLLPPASSL